ncbi:MAG: aldose 1-epimerase [Lentisphaeria bacterium]|nr:aldose 1-epimerase [Lentisphaeria bacterium]
MRELVFGSWTVTAAPECGGNLSQVKYSGVDIMRGYTELSRWIEAPTNFGFAVLFPPNRIDGGKFMFNGKKYQLPVNEPARGNHLHGIALREKWFLDEVTENSLSMSWIFDENAPMHEGYPFDCILRVTYTFTEKALIQEFTVRNCSSDVIPCALGFHSAFPAPARMLVSGKGGRFELPPPRYLMSGRETLWQEGFQPDTWCDPAQVWPFGHFRMDESNRTAVLDYGSFSLRYTVDEKFNHWMVWRPESDTSFICIEPMNIRVGTFENAPGALPVLQAEESTKFTSKIEIMDMPQ